MKVQLYGIIGAVVLFLVLSYPFQSLYGKPIFRFEDLHWQDWALVALVFFAGITVHELIHGLTAILYAGIPTQQARFGFQWKSLTPYFHSKVAIPAGKFRVVVVMPLIALGIIPYIAGLATGMGGLVAFGIMFIICAGGDVLILWLMKGLSSDTLVQDHPEKIGLIVQN